MKPWPPKSKPPNCSFKDNYIAEHIPDLSLSSEIEKLSYIETLELQGRQGPMSARERNMLISWRLLARIMFNRLSNYQI